MKSILTIVAILPWLYGCGASTTSSDNASGASSPFSNNGTGIPGTGNIYQGAVWADCNGFNSSNFQGVVSSYVNPTTQSYMTTWIKLKFNNISSSVINSTQYVEFFAWKETTPGQRQVNQTPVSFYLQSKVTGQIVNPSSPMTVLSANTIQNAINSYGLSGQGVSTSNFFSSVIIILTGLTTDYQAVSIALYDSAQGTSALAATDVLLPVFQANPSVYNTAHPIPDLQALHPLASLIGNGMSDQQYLAQTQSFCQQF